MKSRHPAVATALASQHLQRLGCDCAAVKWQIDWPGPVDIPLNDEAGVQAACAVMAVHGRRYGHPTALPIPYASTMAGVLAAQGVLAALVDRHRGGSTRWAATSVAQAALLAVSQYLAATTAHDAPPEQHGAGGPPFISADGVAFEIETFHAEQWQRFWRLLGAEQASLRRGWQAFEQRFTTASCPLPRNLHTVAARQPYRRIAACGQQAEVSVVAVNNAAVSTAPWRITPLAFTGDTTREPGHTPLHGFVVVEATRRLQGPLAGHLLRLLGAEVIRIEPPGGDPQRGVPPMAGEASARFLALNRGKRVVQIDLRSRTARSQVADLVADADVFLHNWAPGRAAQWGLDASDLERMRPGLVYGYASGWGDTMGSDPPIGTDFMVQAHSGLAARVTAEGSSATPSLVTITDILGGLVCAEAVLGGLLARIHTGKGQRVDCSLLSAAGVLLDMPRTPLASVPIPVCTDVSDIAEDPRFAAALEHGDCTFVGPPWQFGS